MRGIWNEGRICGSPGDVSGEKEGHVCFQVADIEAAIKYFLPPPLIMHWMGGVISVRGIVPSGYAPGFRDNLNWVSSVVDILKVA